MVAALTKYYCKPELLCRSCEIWHPSLKMSMHTFWIVLKSLKPWPEGLFMKVSNKYNIN